LAIPSFPIISLSFLGVFLFVRVTLRLRTPAYLFILTITGQIVPLSIVLIVWFHYWISGHLPFRQLWPEMLLFPMGIILFAFLFHEWREPFNKKKLEEKLSARIV